jgi:NRAMP (natural resistance-associated macrophage protein)-like metal ion transporter
MLLNLLSFHRNQRKGTLPAIVPAMRSSMLKEDSAPVRDPLVGHRRPERNTIGGAGADSPESAEGPSEGLPAGRVVSPLRAALSELIGSLGPGLITGASDDDPSGISTYSIAGASFGYSFLWTALFSFPLMTAVQLMCARLGTVKGKGLAAVVRDLYPSWVLWGTCGLLLFANLVNASADLAGMADATQLATGIPAVVWTPIYTAAITVLLFWSSYRFISNIFRWLTLVLFGYVAAAFLAGIDWRVALSSTIVPHLAWSRDSLAMFVGIMGTTISPYLFFWQAAQEVEEKRSVKNGGSRRSGNTKTKLKKAGVDVFVGMFFSNAIMYFIILTTGTTLHAHGQTHIETAQQAAEALRPLAGKRAYWLFTLGLIGTGMLGVPALVGSGPTPWRRRRLLPEALPINVHQWMLRPHFLNHLVADAGPATQTRQIHLAHPPLLSKIVHKVVDIPAFSNESHPPSSSRTMTFQSQDHFLAMRSASISITSPALCTAGAKRLIILLTPCSSKAPPGVNREPRVWYTAKNYSGARAALRFWHRGTQYIERLGFRARCPDRLTALHAQLFMSPCLELEATCQQMSCKWKILPSGWIRAGHVTVGRFASSGQHQGMNLTSPHHIGQRRGTSLSPGCTVHGPVTLIVVRRCLPRRRDVLGNRKPAQSSG